MPNSSGEGILVNTNFSASPSSVKLFTAINVLLSITATLGNVLILLALHRVSSIYPPTKFFFRCLAITDLSVGLITQPLYIIYNISSLVNVGRTNSYAKHLERVRIASSAVLCGLSLLTSTAISVDRLLALLLKLRYRNVVTLARVRLTMLCFLVFSALCAVIWVWKEDVFHKVSSLTIVLSLATSIASYVKIHLSIRHQQAQIQNHVPQAESSSGGNPLHMIRYKRIVSSILWVQLALIVCYVPYVIVAGSGKGNGVVWLAVTTLVFLSSSLNPILYCWKIREVRQAVKDTVTQLHCCCRQNSVDRQWSLWNSISGIVMTTTFSTHVRCCEESSSSKIEYGNNSFRHSVFSPRLTANCS